MDATATRKRWTLVAAVLGSGIVFLDSTVVNVALPKIGEDLHSSLLGAFRTRQDTRNEFMTLIRQRT